MNQGEHLEMKLTSNDNVFKNCPVITTTCYISRTSLPDKSLLDDITSRHIMVNTSPTSSLTSNNSGKWSLIPSNMLYADIIISSRDGPL